MFLIQYHALLLMDTLISVTLIRVTGLCLFGLRIGGFGWIRRRESRRFILQIVIRVILILAGARQDIWMCPYLIPVVISLTKTLVAVLMGTLDVVDGLIIYLLFSEYCKKMKITTESVEIFLKYCVAVHRDHVSTCFNLVYVHAFVMQSVHISESNLHFY
ncbi:uncharacterized protein PRCAT00001411001 [Priceomyces carsonii]|uniref:uncharacterized protein n=1 Tax=Priceomyces carsonii TaxID=28549 RepID=UPI002ED8D6F5|nr:unnamed protein product [Priceomyces carsonii]